MRIVLCGMMGCGKTTVARALSDRLGWEWVDTDEWIVRHHGQISEIFAQKGEAHFRDLETEAVRALPCGVPAVVSVGGGLVLKAENVRLLKAQGKIVYLQAEKETLQRRLEGDTTRPLLAGEALSARLDELLSARSAVYEGAADIVVCVDRKTPAEIADEIVGKLGL